MARTEAIRIIFERPYGGEANNVLRGTCSSQQISFT